MPSTKAMINEVLGMGVGLGLGLDGKRVKGRQSRQSSQSKFSDCSSSKREEN